MPNLFNKTTITIPTNNVYSVGQQIILNLSIFMINGTVNNNFILNKVSIFPSETYSNTTSGNNLIINFSGSKHGRYGVLINITDSSNSNNSELKKYTFFVGNESSNSLIYYFREALPTKGQHTGLIADSGSISTTQPITSEIRYCGEWVQFSPNELPKPFGIINNISVNWWVMQTPIPFPQLSYTRIEKSATFTANSGDYSNDIPATGTSPTFVRTNFTNLNITRDYIWENYFLAIKLDSDGPRAVNASTNETNSSYVIFETIYTGPKINEFIGNGNDDIRELSLLSSVYDDEDQKNVTLQFDGAGSFNLSLDMVNSSKNYSVLYDGIACTSQSCVINDQTNGTLNLTLIFSSLHNLTIYETPAAVEDTTEETSSGSSTVPTYTPQASQLEKGYTKTLIKNWQINFNIEGSSHKLKVDKIENNSATITISSDPITFTLFVDESRKLDLNNDGFYDLFVKLNSVVNKQGNFFIQKIHEEIMEEEDEIEEKTEEQIPEPTRPGNIIIFIAGAVIILVLIALFILELIKRKKKK
jgi:hypothetical protein